MSSLTILASSQSLREWSSCSQSHKPSRAFLYCLKLAIAIAEHINSEKHLSVPSRQPPRASEPITFSSKMALSFLPHHILINRERLSEGDFILLSWRENVIQFKVTQHSIRNGAHDFVLKPVWRVDSQYEPYSDPHSLVQPSTSLTTINAQFAFETGSNVRTPLLTIFYVLLNASECDIGIFRAPQIFVLGIDFNPNGPHRDWHNDPPKAELDSIDWLGQLPWQVQSRTAVSVTAVRGDFRQTLYANTRAAQNQIGQAETSEEEHGPESDRSTGADRRGQLRSTAERAIRLASLTETQESMDDQDDEDMQNYENDEEFEDEAEDIEDAVSESDENMVEFEISEDGNTRRTPPARRAVVACQRRNLAAWLRLADGQEECGICREVYAPYTSVMTLPCNHRGCESCFSEWLLERSGSCPYCRATVGFPEVRQYSDNRVA